MIKDVKSLIKKVLISCFMISLLLIGACQSHISLINLVLLDEVVFTFEKKESIVANDSINHNSPLDHGFSSPNYPPDENFVNPEDSTPPNEEINDQTNKNPITSSDPTVPEEDTPTEGIEGFYDAAIEQEVINLVNDLRIELGLEALERTETLTMTARLKSEDMAKYNYFSHEGHLVFASLLDSYQVPFQISGENIFKSQSPILIASEIFEAWKASPTHYANMINEQFEKIGVGVYGIEQEGVRTYYVTQHLTD